MLPVVSGVGHETDFTICDFVADLRAPTPTAAAAAVTPDRIAIAHRVEQLARRLSRSAQHVLAVRAQRLDAATRRLVHPAARIAQETRAPARIRPANSLMRGARILARNAIAAATLQARLLRELRAPLHPMLRVEHALARLAARRARAWIARRRNGWGAWRRTSRILNPEAVLERGYAIVGGQRWLHRAGCAAGERRRCRRAHVRARRRGRHDHASAASRPP